MNRLNGKRMILWILTLVFCVTACMPAFASVGDRIVIRNSTANEEVNVSVNTVFRIGDGFCVYGRKDTGYYFSLYADAQAEPETFVMEDRNAEETQDEFGSYTYTSEYFNTLFSWKDELYAIVFRQVSGDDFYRTEKIWFQKVKMENGVATLEECDLPEPDFSALKDGDDENGYYNNLDSAFTVGDTLVGLAYTENGRNIYAFDLETGFCTEYDLGDMAEMIPGPEGTVLLSKVDWSEKGTVTTMSQLNLADGSNETIWQKDEELYNTNPVYDPDTNTLYYTYTGELWAAPDMDIERAEAVNDLDTAYGAIMLPGGFILVWDYNVVQIKNTDPAQRGSIRLRISDNGYGGALGETITVTGAFTTGANVTVSTAGHDEPRRKHGYLCPGL